MCPTSDSYLIRLVLNTFLQRVKDIGRQFRGSRQALHSHIYFVSTNEYFVGTNLNLMGTDDYFVEMN